MRLLPVLVRPLYAGNVGAAVRVAANFGLPDLVLVDPRCNVDSLEFRRMAMGGQERVRLRLAATLAEAVGGADVTVTTTSGRDRDPRQLLAPRQVAERIAAPGVDLVAVAFGSERGGLTQRELLEGHLWMAIPANPDFPTLNLVQSLAIALAFLLEGAMAPPAPDHRLDQPGGASEVEAALAHLRESLLESGFLDPQNPLRVMKQLASWLTRAVPTRRELAILRGIAAHVSYLYGRRSDD